MRNAVIIIHCSIERIDHPLKFARLIADDSFFAVECVLRKFFEQRLRNQFLGPDIDFEFDVVLGGLIHLHWFLEVAPQHFAGGASRFNGGVEIMRHHRLARTKNTECTTKTNRRTIALTSILSPGERRTQVAGVLGIGGGRPYAKRLVRVSCLLPYITRIHKKTGGEIKFSPRVEVWVLAPKSFRSREAH